MSQIGPLALSSIVSKSCIRGQLMPLKNSLPTLRWQEISMLYRVTNIVWSLKRQQYKLSLSLYFLFVISAQDDKISGNRMKYDLKMKHHNENIQKCNLTNNCFMTWISK